MLPKWGRYRLVDIGHSDVQAWISGLAKTHAPSTVRQIFLTLSGLMKYAIRDGRLSRNPCDGVHLPRVTRKTRGYLTHEQVRDLAAGCGDEYADLVLFLAYTGLRWGEMAALKVGRIDMLRRRIDVSEGVTAPRGQLVWSTPKSHASRSVPFPAFLATAIAQALRGPQEGRARLRRPGRRRAPQRQLPPPAVRGRGRRVQGARRRVPDAHASTTSVTPPRASRSRPAPTSRPCSACSATPRRP